MNTADLDHLLEQSLADRHVQAAEKAALADWAARHARDEADRAVARSRAFAVARSAIQGEALQVVDWLEEVVKVFARPVAAPVTLEAAAAFFSPGSTCIQEVLRQFNSARQTCDVCVFTITDDRITDAILRANARGLKLRVVTDDERCHDLGSDIDRLKAAGIPCKMDVGNVAHMHHKFALFDGKRLMTGSFNWTRSASEQNEESRLTTADPALVAAFAERFERLWARMRDH
ncbi:MAG TPA: phospholipase D-like domain-containing protein [Gemmataceae bacterium]|nr:phospholipase D-like domain-containing protein [Gemmataceae bacterium]